MGKSTKQIRGKMFQNPFKSLKRAGVYFAIFYHDVVAIRTLTPFKPNNLSTPPVLT